MRLLTVYRKAIQVILVLVFISSCTLIATRDNISLKSLVDIEKETITLYKSFDKKFIKAKQKEITRVHNLITAYKNRELKKKHNVNTVYQYEKLIRLYERQTQEYKTFGPWDKTHMKNQIWFMSRAIRSMKETEMSKPTQK